VGVLALQGAFREHIRLLGKIPGVTAVAVRTQAQLDSVQGLVLPGGESTTMGLVAERSGLLPGLRDLVAKGECPIFATCAGLIMLADKAEGQKDGDQPLLGGLRVTVDRNHFGTQLQSFQTELEINADELGGSPTCTAMFIRAPSILEVHDDTVEVLATLPQALSPNPLESGDSIVAARQGTILVTAFHPELTEDLRWHEVFVRSVQARIARE